MKTIIILATTLIAQAAFAESSHPAQEVDLKPVAIQQTFEIKPGDTKIIPLHRFVYIDRLSLEANTGLFCGNDPFRVSFDGYRTQSIAGDGGLRGYRTKILHVDMRAKSLEIFNSTACKIKIKNITVLPKRWSEHGHYHPGPVYLPHSDAAAQVSFLIETLAYVQDYVNDSDRSTFLTPLKKTLGKALAILNTNPETSQASVRAIREVLASLEDSHPLIEKLSTIEATFEAAQEIQSVEAALKRMIR